MTLQTALEELAHYYRAVPEAYARGYEEARKQFEHTLRFEVEQMRKDICEMIRADFNAQVTEESRFPIAMEYDLTNLSEVGPELKHQTVMLKNVGYIIDVRPKEKFMKTLRGKIKATESRGGSR